MKNSITTAAVKAAAAVRAANGWKVRDGVISRPYLARWAKYVYKDVLVNPQRYAHWGIFGLTSEGGDFTEAE